MSEIIYAPIREKYIESHNKDHKCPFCNYHKDGKYILHEGNTCVVVANRYPYLYGHLLVFPKRHITDIVELNKDEDKDMMLLIKRAIKQLKLAFNPDGFDVGYQTQFGGGSIEHVHFHIVPRFKGDTGFMTILENANVMSEKPEDMVQKLKRKNHMV